MIGSHRFDQSGPSLLNKRGGLSAPMSYSRNVVLALGAFIVVVYFAINTLLPDAFVNSVTRQNGPIDTFGALSLLVASGLFFLCLLRARRGGSTRIMQLFLLGLAVAFLIGAGEESSWGQQFFHFGTPDSIKAHNDQQELTIHNLHALGEFGVWRAFEIFTLLFAVALPLTAWWSARARALLWPYVPIVPLALSGLFLLARLMVFITVLINNDAGPWGGPWARAIGVGTELDETVFALLYAVVAFDMWRRFHYAPHEIDGLQARRAAVDALGPAKVD
jgi:hypothetical protein